MAQAFNPATWLSTFEQFGGAYVLTGDRLCLWIFPGDLTPEQLTAARGMVAELRSANRAQIIQHLRSPARVAA
jgi:hypothetical protein